MEQTKTVSHASRISVDLHIQGGGAHICQKMRDSEMDGLGSVVQRKTGGSDHWEQNSQGLLSLRISCAFGQGELEKTTPASLGYLPQSFAMETLLLSIDPTPAAGPKHLTELSRAETFRQQFVRLGDQ